MILKNQPEFFFGENFVKTKNGKGLKRSNFAALFAGVRNMNFPVRAYLKKGVKNPKFVNDQVRRTADLLGHPGIIAKRGQFDTVIAKQGFLCTLWPNRQLAKKFQALVKKSWGNSIKTRRFHRKAR